MHIAHSIVKSRQPCRRSIQEMMMSNQTRKPVLMTSTTNSSNGCGSKICIKYRKYLKRVLHGGVVRVSDWFSKGWVFEPQLRRSIHEMIMSNQTRKPVLMTSTNNSSNGCGSKICTMYRKRWKSYVSLKLSGQTCPILAGLKISVILLKVISVEKSAIYCFAFLLVCSWVSHVHRTLLS